ncbi:tRNA (adenine-N1)-methyltransferase [Anaerocellum diazotrophicum]|uniref:tRNA (adenine(58)-N(1))-methyltransferase TrmI n=1 Tax=Caldicellulosiruptor diazotrophicus TaxID=2806205 RepID=A0ABM7NJQ8_9FIRM|nr:tRNA (adenine-N1)-methyltransferase [Caldicellulosiruptor diazotrophicus]BCS80337.1 SAM-dependent methyltransferase [Caldicellulosiruptor diazotrophicus]
MEQLFDTKRVIIGPEGFKKVVDISVPKRVNLPTGYIETGELAKILPGGSFFANDVEYYVFPCDTFDYVMHFLKRHTQIVYPKDGAYILMKLDIHPGKRVGEAGTGSGAFTLYLSMAVGPEGKVYTYEQREEFFKMAEKNIKNFSKFDNVVMHNKSIVEGIEEKDLDAFFLDIREPEEAISAVREALKPAGHLGILVPTTNQVSETLVALQNYRFYVSEVVEIMMRQYKPVPERLRPDDRMIGHTAYMIFARKIL